MPVAALPGLLVTGTDTGVGKTLIASSVLRCLRARGVAAGALKPVATGPTREDAEALRDALGLPVEVDHVSPRHYPEPLAPCVAARRAGTPLLHEDLLSVVAQALHWWSQRASLMIVEGVGGLLCPLAEGTTVADLAIALDYPIIIVARRGLGTLNHTLLTLEAAQARGLRVAGLVLNGAEATRDPIAEWTNPDELARRLGLVPLLAEVPHGLPREEVDRLLRGTDWSDLARAPRRLGMPTIAR